MGRKHLASAGMDEAIAAWVCARNPHMDLGDMPYSAIGQLDALGNIIGGVVYTLYTGRDIQASVAGAHRRFMTRRFLGEIFRYPFLQLGVRRMTILIGAENVHSQQFCEKLGFQYEGVLRAFLPEDENCLVYGMLREECRFLSVGVLPHGSPSEHQPAERAQPAVAGASPYDGIPAHARIAPLRRAGEPGHGG